MLIKGLGIILWIRNDGGGVVGGQVVVCRLWFFRLSRPLEV